MREPVEVMTADLAESGVAEDGYVGPTSDTERVFAEILAAIADVERVSVDMHVFDDLGVDSLVMARFCAKVRKRPDLPSVSMKQVYGNPTLRSLAAAVTNAASAPVPATVPVSTEVATPARTSEYVLCGVLQLLSAFGYAYLAAFAVVQGYHWIAAGSGLIEHYVRSGLVGGAGFLGMCSLPILAKWLLIGRWKPQQIRIWSLGYFRFWLVRTLIRSNPLVLFVGSPIYVLYLRALGAKIGRRVVIFSTHVPVCTDLLTIGANTIVRKDSFFTGYRARGGLIQTGPVRLGKDALVGEATVLDIETSLGDGAQLGHSSSLHAGQSVPDGEHRHGSPALQRTDVDYRAVDPAHCGTPRRAVYSVLQLLNILVLLLPLSVGGVVMLADELPQLAALLASGSASLSSGAFYSAALGATFVLFFGSVLVGLLLVFTVPRLLNLAIKPDKVYRLYGVHFWAHRAIARTSNVRFFTYLFGDSSYIVHYLRWLGYDLSRVEQTGSNFGLDVKHDNPFLASVGRGTMAADGLSIINADYSNSSFRVSRTTIGPHNFIGNYVAYPSQGRTGDNCLLATKVMVPIDGDVREDLGLLGSPSFEIPRSVHRDSQFDHLKSPDELGRRLRSKNKHNAVTMALFLGVRWIYLFGITLLAAGAAALYGTIGASALALALVLSTVFSIVYFALVERASTLFRALQPQYCSIYEPYFWSHERYWKLSTQLMILNGTPFKGLAWRLLGVRIGRRVFDDGCIIMEKTLVTVGDDCAFNAGSIIQPHSQEDGAFKSDRISIGTGCTLGVASLVHYGVTMGDGATLAADAFLMKGAEIAPNACWGDNPASEVRDEHPVVAATSSVSPPWPSEIGTAPTVSGGQEA